MFERIKQKSEESEKNSISYLVILMSRKIKIIK